MVAAASSDDPECREIGDRLRRFLGPEYEHVMRYTIADAFADSFRRDASETVSIPN